MIYKISAAAVLLATALASNAALLSVDDYTIDTSTGLEWLDMQLTEGASLYDVFHGFGGYAAAGWKSAGTDQLVMLFDDAGGDGNYGQIAIANPANAPAAQLLANLLNPGQTGAFGTTCGGGYSGQSDDDYGECYSGAFSISSAGGYLTYFVQHVYPEQVLPGLSNFLVRVAPVPEPSEYALMLAGLVGVVGFARRKRRG